MGVVYVPKVPHECDPGPGDSPRVAGMVWACDECGSHWVLRGRPGDWRWYGEGLISKFRRWRAGRRHVR